MPSRQADGTASWSLLTLRQALRSAPDGLPHISTATIRAALVAAGWTWQRTRSWCETGTAVRRRKAGPPTAPVGPHSCISTPIRLHDMALDK
jgi:hypothetical protein